MCFSQYSISCQSSGGVLGIALGRAHLLPLGFVGCVYWEDIFFNVYRMVAMLPFRKEGGRRLIRVVVGGSMVSRHGRVVRQARFITSTRSGLKAEQLVNRSGGTRLAVDRSGEFGRAPDKARAVHVQCDRGEYILVSFSDMVVEGGSSLFQGG
jgi:hypothetical protein